MGDRLSKGKRYSPSFRRQEPFRFIDEIVELDEEHIVATLHVLAKDADFYRGHFPGNPITPGVILTETMAQAGVVAFGIYLVYALETSLERSGARCSPIFTDANVDFTGAVLPGRSGDDDRSQEVLPAQEAARRRSR